jgi:2',3'-cyclic-nucleotide 2'-phosphodiesterase (5'-nucleotidase family)
MWLTPLILATTVLSGAGALKPQWSVHALRPARSQSISPPSRPLQWGDINVIATTDTHGWLLGHEKRSFPEPNYRFAAISLAA